MTVVRLQRGYCDLQLSSSFAAKAKIAGGHRALQILHISQ